MFRNKMLLWFSSIMLVLSVTMITGCKDDDNPTDPGGGGNGGGSFTLNGAGFSNSTMTVSASIAAFVTNQNLTYVNTMGKVGNDSAFVVVVFPGQSGTSQWDEETSMVGVSLMSSSRFFQSLQSGSTTVNSYGNVGQTITGSVNGTLYDGLGDSLRISGNFSAQRLPDQDSIGAPVKLENIQIRTF